MNRKIKVPWLPLSALFFYLFVVFLWNMEIIPAPAGIVSFLESLYSKHGFLGVFIAVFFEGIVYLGLYFPGSFLMALAVILSGGGFWSLMVLSVTATLAVTLASFINYFAGRMLTNRVEKSHVRKGLFFSILHPNILAFYFLNEGLHGRGVKEILYVPFLMLPYILTVSALLSLTSNFARRHIENPYVMITVLLIWLVASFILKNRNIFFSSRTATR